MADEQITSNTANIPYLNLINVGSDQAAPAAGRAILYIKDGVAYVRLDTGDPVPVSGSVALAEGQLAIGNGSGVLSALALGTEGDVVTADASGMASWVAPAPPAGGAVTKLDTVTVGAGGAADMTFSAIPGTYTHLELHYIAGRESGGTDADVLCQVNDTAGTNYRSNFYKVDNAGGGASVQSGPNFSSWLVGQVLNPAAYTNDWQFGRLYFPFYAVSGPARSCQADSVSMHWENSSFTRSVKGSGQVAVTSAITKIKLFLSSGGDFIEGSRAVLYGID